VEVGVEKKKRKRSKKKAAIVIRSEPLVSRSSLSRHFIAFLVLIFAPINCHNQ